MQIEGNRHKRPAFMKDGLTKRRRLMALGSVSVANASGGFIPDDILFFKILILLPAKCLLRLQSVCKLWRSTISSAYFIRSHLEHSKHRSSTVIMPRKYQADRKKVGIRGVTFYRFEPGQSKVAELILEKKCPNGISMFSMPLHCDGLILIPCTTGQIFVCNPSTTEFVELPQGSHNVVGDHKVAFGFDPRSGKYKVARHFFRSYSEKPRVDGQGIVMQYSAGHEVLTLGGGEDAWKWKATVDPSYAINSRTPICLPGVFYWSAFHPSTGHADRNLRSHVILRFNLHDEMFTVHPNPPCRGFVSKNDRLCELGGKLCYVHSASMWEVAIWLAEDRPSKAWSMCCNVTMSADQDKIFLSVDARYSIF